MRFIHFLLGDKAGLALRNIEHARVGQMRDLMRRLSALQFVTSCGELGV